MINYQHSTKLPLKTLIENLQDDPYYQSKAVQILEAESPSDKDTPPLAQYAVESLLHHWISTTYELRVYRFGKKVDLNDVTLPVRDDNGNFAVGTNYEFFEETTLIDRDEFARVLKKRNLKFPAYWAFEYTPDHTEEPSDGLAIFSNMRDLMANEIALAFIPGDMIQVSARGTQKRVAYSELSLLDRRKGTLNKQGGILLGMARRISLPKSSENARAISRLRKTISNKLGVKDDPFFPCRPNVGWEPQFTVTDNTNTADERARREAIHVPRQPKLDFLA